MDKLQFPCEHCGQKLRAGAHRVGQRVPCPKCKQPTTIVAPSGSVADAAVVSAGTTRAAETAQAATATSPPTASSSSATATTSKSAKRKRRRNSAKTSPEESAHNAPPTSITATTTTTTTTPPVATQDAKVGEAPPVAPEAQGTTATPPDPFESFESFDEGVSGNDDAELANGEESSPDEYAALAQIGDTHEHFDPFAFEETEWVVDTEEEADSPKSFDPHKVAVPRRILYMQGALLAATALFAFLMGIFFGRTFAPQSVAFEPPQPCSLAGKIEFARGGNNLMPDEGSVVIAVPRDYTPDLRERLELEKISSATDDRDPSVDMLRNIGGDFAITDRLGRFQLNLPDKGRYYVLVLSANSQRPATEDFNRLHLSEMGAYFGAAHRLIGDRRYHWRSEHVTEDQSLTILF